MAGGTTTSHFQKIRKDEDEYSHIDMKIEKSEKIHFLFLHSQKERKKHI
jgi:hypothetical protein